MDRLCNLCKQRKASVQFKGEPSVRFCGEQCATAYWSIANDFHVSRDDADADADEQFMVNSACRIQKFVHAGNRVVQSASVCNPAGAYTRNKYIGINQLGTAGTQDERLEKNVTSTGKTTPLGIFSDNLAVDKNVSGFVMIDADNGVAIVDFLTNPENAVLRTLKAKTLSEQLKEAVKAQPTKEIVADVLLTLDSRNGALWNVAVESNQTPTIDVDEGASVLTFFVFERADGTGGDEKKKKKKDANNSTTRALISWAGDTQALVFDPLATKKDTDLGAWTPPHRIGNAKETERVEKVIGNDKAYDVNKKRQVVLQTTGRAFRGVPRRPTFPVTRGFGFYGAKARPDKKGYRPDGVVSIEPQHLEFDVPENRSTFVVIANRAYWQNVLPADAKVADREKETRQIVEQLLLGALGIDAKTKKKKPLVPPSIDKIIKALYEPVDRNLLIAEQKTQTGGLFIPRDDINVSVIVFSKRK